MGCPHRQLGGALAALAALAASQVKPSRSKSSEPEQHIPSPNTRQQPSVHQEIRICSFLFNHFVSSIKHLEKRFAVEAFVCIHFEPRKAFVSFQNRWTHPTVFLRILRCPTSLRRSTSVTFRDEHGSQIGKELATNTNWSGNQRTPTQDSLVVAELLNSLYISSIDLVWLSPKPAAPFELRPIFGCFGWTFIFA